MGAQPLSTASEPAVFCAALTPSRPRCRRCAAAPCERSLRAHCAPCSPPAFPLSPGIRDATSLPADWGSPGQARPVTGDALEGRGGERSGGGCGAGGGAAQNPLLGLDSGTPLCRRFLRKSFLSRLSARIPLPPDRIPEDPASGRAEVSEVFRVPLNAAPRHCRQPFPPLVPTALRSLRSRAPLPAIHRPTRLHPH